MAGFNTCRTADGETVKPQMPTKFWENLRFAPASSPRSIFGVFDFSCRTCWSFLIYLAILSNSNRKIQKAAEVHRVVKIQKNGQQNIEPPTPRSSLKPWSFLHLLKQKVFLKMF